MDKQELIESFGEFLELGKAEQPAAFKIFTRKLKDILGPNDALRIPDFGIFQLKKEPTPRAERGEGVAEQSTAQALIFSPPLEDLSSRSKALFQTIEINGEDKEAEAFSEKVFSLGFDQPMIPISENSGEAAKGMTEQDLEEKIETVIAKSELLRNFDLWTDYLGDKEEEGSESTDTAEIKENALGISEESIETELDIDEAENDSVEDETTEEASDNVDWDWSDELHDAIEGGKKEKSEDEIELVVEDPFDSIGPNETTEDEHMEDSDKAEEKTDVSDATTRTEIDESTNTGNTYEEEKEESAEAKEASGEIQSDDRGEPIVSGNTEIAPMFSHPHNEENPPEPDEEEPKKRSYSIYIWAAVGVALLIVIYFGYFSGEDAVEIPGEETHVTSDSGDGGETLSAVPLDSKSQIKPVEQQNAQEERTDDSKDQNAAQNRASSRKPDAKPPTTSKPVGNLVFYDGDSYSVQVASYQTRSSAQREVDKLRRTGRDAFIVEAFIEKFNSTWYRVRVGGFTTKEEAQNFKLN